MNLEELTQPALAGQKPKSMKIQMQLNEPRFLQRLDELEDKTASLVHHLLLLPELLSDRAGQPSGC